MAPKYQAIYRLCQQCGVASQVSAFKLVRESRRRVGFDRQVHCPSCGYMAPVWASPVVEQPAEHGEERS